MNLDHIGAAVLITAAVALFIWGLYREVTGPTRTPTPSSGRGRSLDEGGRA